MKTPPEASTDSIQLKSNADWAHIDTRGEVGSSRERTSTMAGKSTVSQRNRLSGSAACNRQKLVCRPSASATTVADG
ncbi:MAG: hypothetical protein QOC58_53 [Mycobacterium sp.]|nr:hypothetical protein [Mycobacterium sp.]